MILKPMPTKSMPFLCATVSDPSELISAWLARRHGLLMRLNLAGLRQLPVIPQNEHEWRALLSEWFAMLSGAISTPEN
jgi:hypothetical protein